MSVYRLLLTVVFCSAGIAQQSQRDELLQKLAKKPFDTTVLGSVQESRDQVFLPALRKAFADTAEKLVKQYIAVTIVRLGDPSAEYFDYLAGFALEAVRSPAPAVLDHDAAGHMVRGKVSREFEAWSRDHGVNIKEEVGKQIMVFPSDLFELAQTHDRRAANILREGLESNSPTIVQISAYGLASLQDTASIQRIVAARRRFTPDDVDFGLGSALAEYDGDAAQTEILAALGDASVRRMYTEALQRKRGALPGPR